MYLIVLLLKKGELIPTISNNALQVLNHTHNVIVLWKNKTTFTTCDFSETCGIENVCSVNQIQKLILQRKCLCLYTRSMHTCIFHMHYFKINSIQVYAIHRGRTLVWWTAHTQKRRILNTVFSRQQRPNVFPNCTQN